MKPTVKLLFVSAALLLYSLPYAQEPEPPQSAPAPSPAVDSGAKVTLETLAGPLPRLVKADRSPYLIIADIEVPANRTVTIEPGTVLLFRSFCGLHVHGRLIAEGSRSEPIVFSSEFDHTFNPQAERFANPYDWNGVYVHPDGFGTRMTFSKIQYSVYGLISETKFVRLDPLQLQRNGKQVLTIENTEYKASDKGECRWVLEAKDAVVDGVPVDILKDPMAPRRNTFRYLGLAALLGGCAAGTYQAVRALPDSEQNYKARQSDDFTNTGLYTESQYRAARRELAEDRLLTAAGFVVGLLGAVSFAWTFSF